MKTIELVTTRTTLAPTPTSTRGSGLPGGTRRFRGGRPTSDEQDLRRTAAID